MSEKRFSFDTEQRSVGEIQVIIDNKEKKVYANCFSICEKLNELAEENEQLRKELGDCEKFRYTTFKRMRDVLDE